MFSSLSGVVIHRPWLVLLSWLVLAGALFWLGPRWDQVTKDDDVRFFPAESLSVIGQDLLERGFPSDASSSQLVLVYERKSGRVTPEDFQHIEDAASRFFQFADSHSEFGIDKRPDTPRTPVIGPRLIGTSADGTGQAVLAIVRFDGTYLSRKTRVAVDEILKWVKSEQAGLPRGLELALTGSAVVGHDTNAAANESIKNTTDSTIALVVVILLVVYRSPLLAMIPLVTIALSVFVSLRLIAMLTLIPSLGFKVINITQVFVVVVLFGAGTDYCLFLIARYTEELKRGRVEAGCASASDSSGRGGSRRQRRHGDRRAGNALFLQFRQGQVHRADDRAFARGRASGRADPGARDAGIIARGDLLAIPGAPGAQS